ncbi:2-isopropylmalate synthase [Truepera radiovictrix]|uniref:2-isopropylmalate synthase n=1 Tax=Truepera radiovictrix (strain DSM 17093 / CIP 108686 / LMG 22925 / RQ-24) TaxID=649638 RepID=D7CXY7_TRURR|nr:2-isopropylmalate synthase [Truepera radiovictrix]ADI13347.1 2-isopropylmalate synthase [Truepera radiovictrix DSM 17093]WMT58090.1 2-isopropylmalate synthase [Truepera radiovictrix]
MAYIKIFDTTLRDGEQTPGVTLNTAEKVEIAKQLARLGVDIIEAGFPITSTGDFEAVSRIAKEVSGPTICALARTARADIERAAQALEGAERARIHVFTSGSKIHLEHMLRKTPEEVIEASVESVRLARQFTGDVEFSAQDCTRSELAFLYALYGAAIEAGATVINIPDTVGYGMPLEYAELIRNIRDNVPGAKEVDISTHCHDDLGLAVANSLAAIGAGATQVECTVNGIGERAGNTSLEEVVMALGTRRDVWGHETGINTRELYRTSRMVAMYTGVSVPPNKAVVGDNAFAHESGIHQDGVIKALETYEIMSAETVGRDAGVLVMGKHSGRRAFRKTLEELGYELDDEKVNVLFKQFKDLCDRKQKVTSEDIRALIDAETARVPQTYELMSVQFQSGTGMIPVATVRLKTDTGIYEEAATGDGPVDAVYRALERVAGLPLKLESYEIRSVGSGKDALGEVSIRASQGERLVHGRGLSTDVIEASAQAYVDVLNKFAAGIGKASAQQVATP